MIDLHLHTLASDGQYSGRRLVEMARAAGLFALAIADHNTVESVAEAETRARELGINFAPAVELDTIFRGRDLHILGYYIAYRSVACEQYLAEIFAAKMEQTRKRVAKLNEAGLKISFDQLMKISEGRLPTGKHFIAVLAGYPENLKDPRVRAYIDGPRSFSPAKNFYLDWLRAGHPAFVPLSEQPAERAIREIINLGGVPVLGHPLDTPEEDIQELVRVGLRGLEVYSSYHDPQTSEKYFQLARRLGLLVTAGSDYHGPEVKPDVEFAGIPGNEDRLFLELQKAAGLS